MPDLHRRDRPRSSGTLSVGFVLDDALAAQFKDADRQRHRVRAGRPDARPRPCPSAARAASARLLRSRRASSTVTLDGDEYVALRRPLLPPAATVGGARRRRADVPVALILRSRTERLRFLRTLRTALAGTRRRRRAAGHAPQLRRGAHGHAPARGHHRRHARDGGHGRPHAQGRAPAAGSWDDEDARLLAATFNTLTDSIARFQREAAQRERLSALGRLSTVVAHEVRNPLMIIKASLRTLRRDRVGAGRAARGGRPTSTTRSPGSTAS